MGKVSYFLNTYNYFSNLKSNINQGLVLDYGSNYGMFLDSSLGQFPEENYTGLDVDKESLNQGKSRFPKANFVWYNGFNVMYNPNGTDVLPYLSSSFDTIISYSVFTHTTKEDMIDKINWLYSKLNPGGSILASFLDADHKISKDFFYKKRLKDFGYCDKIEINDYGYLIENRLQKVLTKNKVNFFLSFYKKDYLFELFKDYSINLEEPFIGIPECFQSCIIIKKK